MDNGNSMHIKTTVWLLVLFLLTACEDAAVDIQPTAPSGGSVVATSTAVSITNTPIPTATTIPATATTAPQPTPDTTPLYSYRVIKTYPHDSAAFTQGLIIEDDIMIEGTGLWGRSSLREVDWDTGEVLKYLPLDDQYFGEGLTVIDDRIIQITWKSNTGFVYDLDSFELIETFHYPTEGWGITHDGERLIVSDGTATVYFWDPETLEEIGRIPITFEGEPVTQLNELEYVNGEIWANIWQTDRIARISPESGDVLGWIDLSGLLPPEDQVDDINAVLNGIAYDDENGRLFVTGKLWPTMFEIELTTP